MEAGAGVVQRRARGAMSSRPWNFQARAIPPVPFVYVSAVWPYGSYRIAAAYAVWATISAAATSPWRSKTRKATTVPTFSAVRL